LRIASEHRRGGERRGADVDQWKLQIVPAEDARLLRDPRHRLGHHPRRLNAEKTVGARSQTRAKIHDDQHDNP